MTVKHNDKMGHNCLGYWNFWYSSCLFFVFRSQIKTQLKRKSFEEAGVPMPTDQSPKKVAVQKQTIPTPGGAAHTTHTKKQKHNGNVYIKYFN